MTTVAERNLEHLAGLARARNPSLTREGALAQVLKANPSLYSELRAQELAPRTFAAPAPPSRAGNYARDAVLVEIDRLASELRRSNSALSLEQSQAEVLVSKPDLYARFVRAEQIDRDQAPRI